MVTTIIRRFGSKWSLGIMIGLLTLGVVGLSANTLQDPNRGPQDANWERIQATGILRVGVDIGIPPFGFIEDEQLTGFDPAVAEALGNQLNLEIQFVPLGFDGLYDALILGEADIVIATLRPDPLRLDRIRYTAPYFDAGQVLVSKTPIVDLNTLNNEDVIAVEFASEGDIFARELPVTIERFLTVEEALHAVEVGNADAALVERVAALLLPHNLTIGETTFVPDEYVIGVRRHDWRLYKVISDALQQIMMDGTLDTLIREWLNPTEG